LATGGALGLVWALVQGGSVGWSSPEIIASLSAGVVLGVFFAWWELRARSPMVPLRLFRERSYAVGNASGFCMFAVMFAMLFFITQFLQTGLGYGPLGAGLRLVPGWATLSVIAPFSGILIGRLGVRPLVVGGLAAVGVSLLWIARIARTGLPSWELIPPLVLLGTGASLVIPATMSAAMTSVPPAMIGQASGTYNTLRQLGGVFGVAICAAVFAAHGGYSSPEAFVSGFRPAMLTCAGLALVGALTGLAAPGRRRPVVAAPSDSRPLEAEITR
jgi:Major Facilitator Superfamily